MPVFRQLFALASVLLIAALMAYNYQQLRYPLLLLDRISIVAEELNYRSMQKSEIQKFHAALIENKLPAADNFKIFYDARLFNRVFFIPKDVALLKGWSDEAVMIKNEQALEKMTLSFNRIKFDANDYDNSLLIIGHWVSRMVALLDAQQASYVRLSAHIAAQLKKEGEPILWVNGLLLCSILSILFGALYSLQREKLRDSRELNQELLGKQSSILKSQKIMVSIMDDIKREKALAVELATKNQQLVSVVYQSSDAIFWLTERGVISNCNNATYRLFNRSGDELVGLKFKTLFSQQDWNAIQAALHLSIERAEASIIHIRFQKPGDPAVMQVLAASFSPLLDQDRQVTGISVIARDISTQYHEREQLRLIIDQAPSALIMTDATGRIAMCNRQVETLFAYAPGELIGQSIEVLVPRHARQLHPSLRHSFIRQPEARAMGAGRDLTGCKKDASEIPVEIGLSPISTSEGQFVIASVVDITERRRTQHELEAFNEKLTQKNKEMEQFIYTVSHDLKSPLVTINAFSNKLYVELFEQLSEKHRHLLVRIQANVAHMEHLLKDLLGLSHLIQQTVDKAWQNTNGILTSVVNALEGEISESNAKLNVKSPLLSIYANESMLFQCLQNLLSNAIKYRDPNRVPVIDIDIQKQADELRLSIKDNGLGIDKRYHEQIFKIFERLGAGDGTGVGLSIVKTIMEKHNGRVLLESAFGSGSTFTLCFPLPATDAPPDVNRPAPVGHDFRNLRS